jgi:hypothetical protein
VDVSEEVGRELGDDHREQVGPLAWLYGPPLARNPHAAREVWEYWVGVLKGRIANKWHNILVVTGEPGAGKSTAAFRLALDVDRAFSPEQTAYSASDMLQLYRDLRAGQVAVYDEAVLGLLSNDFQTPEARELVKAVNIVRAKGITVILCIPDIHRLLAGWREEAVRFWVHCESEPRGVGWMHVRASSLRYERHSTLGLYKDPEWNPIRWASLEGSPFWKAYEKLKLERIDRFMEESLARLHPRSGRERELKRRMATLRRLLTDGYTQREARELTGADWEEVKRAFRSLPGTDGQGSGGVGARRRSPAGQQQVPQ